jgi:hypothetical protein
MVDYIEGLLEIRERLRGVEKALLEGRTREARLLLGDIRHAANETEIQIIRQFPDG